MSQPPTKRRRTTENPFLDLEAAVDRPGQLEEDEAEDDTDRAFIDDESEGEKDGESLAHSMYQARQDFIHVLSKEGHLDGGSAQEEEHAELLAEWLGLDLEGQNSTEDPAWDDNADMNDDEDATAPRRPQWAEIAYTNPAVSGALDTSLDDDPDRQISQEANLYEVSCQPGMEETIVYRIFSWAVNVDSPDRGTSHILPRATANREVLARSAVANPFLRGRVYIESAKIGYVQRLARCVTGLNPASVRPVPRDFLLRPLQMTRLSFPDRTFVRLLDPPCPSMTCITIKDYLLMVPKNLGTVAHEPPAPSDNINMDIHEMPAPPPESLTSQPLLQRYAAGSDICIDQYGFRYIPLKKLGPAALEPYEPAAFEVELLFKYGRLTNRHFQKYMSRIMSYSFSAGDRVIFQAGRLDQLIGTVIDPGNDALCKIYVPSQGSLLEVDRRQLRRHFRIGDRVSATTDDVIQMLGSRIGWVVSASEGYKNAGSSDEAIELAQVGYRVDLRVFSPESGKEVVAAHYEFQFEDDSTVSLQTTTPPSAVSEMAVNAPYTLTIPGVKSFFGVVVSVEGARVRLGGTDASTELSASIIFSIWDKRTDAPFGYPPGWQTSDFTDYRLQLGDTVIMKDRDGRHGTARITGLGKRELSLANFTGALKVSDLHSVCRAGPHDEHIDKSVRVRKGPYRGSVGVVKTVNTIGTCTVELNIQPIRRITINIAHLRAVDDSAIYMSLLPLLAPPPRAQTPPAPAPSLDTPLAFQPSESDVLPYAPPSPDRDCGWLTKAFAQGLSIKLEPVHRKMKRPYHFSSTFYDNAGESPRLMVRVFDRQKERQFPADELRWLPPDDLNQTAVRVTGEDAGTLYFTLLVDGNNCQVRHVPSRRGASLFIIPRLELAQVNAKRT